MRVSEYIRSTCLAGHNNVFEAYQAGVSIDDIVKCMRGVLAMAPLLIVRDVVKKMTLKLYREGDPNIYANMPIIGVNMQPFIARYIDKDGNELVMWDTFDKGYMSIPITDIYAQVHGGVIVDKMWLPVKLADGTNAARQFECTYGTDEIIGFPTPDKSTLPAYVSASPPYKLQWTGMTCTWMSEDMYSMIRVAVGEITLANVDNEGIGTSGNGIFVTIQDDGTNVCGVTYSGIYVGKDTVGHQCNEPLVIYYVRTKAWYALWITQYELPIE